MTWVIGSWMMMAAIAAINGWCFQDKWRREQWLAARRVRRGWNIPRHALEDSKTRTYIQPAAGRVPPGALNYGASNCVDSLMALVRHAELIADQRGEAGK